MKLISRNTGTHILGGDPALDRAHPQFDAIHKEALRTWDWSKVPIKEGHTPAVFTLRKLPRALFQRIMSLEGHDKDVEAVAWSLQSVTGLDIDGEPFVVKHEPIDGKERVRRELLDRIYDFGIITELGVRAFEVSRLHPM